MIDTKALIRAYLATASPATNPLIAIVDSRIFVPRLPENTTLPAVSLLRIGGESTPYIPETPTPLFQFDCWAEDIDGGLSGPRGAREVYNALYDALQGIQEVAVTVGGNTYAIMSAIERGHGIDLVDDQIITYFEVRATFDIMMRTA